MQDDYFDLYRRSAETIKDIDNDLSVGGPATANNEWVDDFVSFCKDKGVPVDFVSTHQYPTQVLGAPGISQNAIP